MALTEEEGTYLSLSTLESITLTYNGETPGNLVPLR